MLDTTEVKLRAQEVNINLRYYLDGSVGLSLDETVGQSDLADLLWVFQVQEILFNLLRSRV